MTVNTYSEFLNFKEKLVSLLDELIAKNNISLSQYTVFISYGRKDKRCLVWGCTDPKISNVKKKLLNFIDKVFKKNKSSLEYFKIDLAYNVEEVDFEVFKETLKNQNHNNHFRKGISLDKDLSISFMEQEVYGRAIIKGLVYNEPNFLDELNLNDAIHKKYPAITKKIELNKLKKIWLFDTYGAFYENSEFVKLNSGGIGNGIRVINKDHKEHIKSLIIKNAEFLHQQILEDGKFIYGYFPAYDREIKSYNTVRHCTAVYALLETLEVEYNADYLEKINVSNRSSF